MTKGYGQTRPGTKSPTAPEPSQSVTLRVPISLKTTLDAEAKRRGTTFTEVAIERLRISPSVPATSSLTGPGKQRPLEDPSLHEGHRQKVVTGRRFCLDHQVFLS